MEEKDVVVEEVLSQEDAIVDAEVVETIMEEVDQNAEN